MSETLAVLIRDSMKPLTDAAISELRGLVLSGRIPKGAALAVCEEWARQAERLRNAIEDLS